MSRWGNNKNFFIRNKFIILAVYFFLFIKIQHPYLSFSTRKMENIQTNCKKKNNYCEITGMDFFLPLELGDFVVTFVQNGFSVARQNKSVRKLI